MIGKRRESSRLSPSELWPELLVPCAALLEARNSEAAFQQSLLADVVAGADIAPAQEVTSARGGFRKSAFPLPRRLPTTGALTWPDIALQEKGPAARAKNLNQVSVFTEYGLGRRHPEFLLPRPGRGQPQSHTRFPPTTQWRETCAYPRDFFYWHSFRTFASQAPLSSPPPLWPSKPETIPAPPWLSRRRAMAMPAQAM